MEAILFTVIFICVAPIALVIAMAKAAEAKRQASATALLQLQQQAANNGTPIIQSPAQSSVLKGAGGQLLGFAAKQALEAVMKKRG